jgi:tetratricopeptide (TPR) repeat protein
LLSAAGLFFLLVCGAGTIQRNVQAFEGPLPLDPAAPSQAASTPPALTESPGRLVSANQMLSRSLTLYQEGKFQESIAVAQAALQIDPNSADAYNNIAAAHASLRQWDEAITAAQQALRLQPDFTLARNNLNWALEQKRLGH